MTSLERSWFELVAGTYMDEFAEWHSKDLVVRESLSNICLLYTSDAADDLLCVDLGGRRIIKKKKKWKQKKFIRSSQHTNYTIKTTRH